jgi:hypothetical protein
LHVRARRNSETKESQLAKERLNQLGGAAQEQGKQAADMARKGFGVLAARMGGEVDARCDVYRVRGLQAPRGGHRAGGAGLHKAASESPNPR